MSTTLATRVCDTPGCDRPTKARGMCHKCYNRWSYSLPGHCVGEPKRVDPSDKITYLASLTISELAAYCAGILSRASVAPGDPDEIATWAELVRLTARRAAE